MKYKYLQGLFLPLLISLTMSATELGDSVDVYQNQTVTTTIYVQGRDTIGVRNVTVNPPGKLKMAAPRSIRIHSGLRVTYGGRIELHAAKQWPVRYSYDSNGNTRSRVNE